MKSLVSKSFRPRSERARSNRSVTAPVGAREDEEGEDLGGVSEVAREVALELSLASHVSELAERIPGATNQWADALARMNVPTLVSILVALSSVERLKLRLVSAS